jgi:hypothetical protein
MARRISRIDACGEAARLENGNECETTAQKGKDVCDIFVAETMAGLRSWQGALVVILGVSQTG